MKSGEGRLVPASLSMVAGLLLAFPLGGCMAVPDVDSDDPLVVTEAGVQPDPDQSPERRAAVAEMRAKARQGDALPYPDAFQAARTAQLAARPEPLPVRSIAAIEAELAEVVRRQQGAVTPAELAALRAREAQLRLLAAQTQAAGAEARRNPAAPVLGR
jgi:hypothetical protein